MRSLEAQTASRLAARDRVDKKQPAHRADASGLEKGVGGRREYYADYPSPSVGMKASRAVTFRFGMGTEES